MAQAKTRQTAASVDEFLDGIESEQVRDDCRTIAGIMQKATGSSGRMWGSGIVGFGTYQCTYADGRTAEWMVVAFAPRRQNLTLYLAADFPERDALMAQLGTHTSGKGCVYIKRLADVHVPTLKKLVALSARHTLRAGGQAAALPSPP